MLLLLLLLSMLPLLLFTWPLLLLQCMWLLHLRILHNKGMGLHQLLSMLLLLLLQCMSLLPLLSCLSLSLLLFANPFVQ